MKETDAIVTGVRVALNAKQEEIEKAGASAIAYVKDAFKKRQKEFIHFERTAAGLAYSTSQKPSVIDSYKQGAEFLLGEISRILVQDVHATHICYNTLICDGSHFLK